MKNFAEKISFSIAVKFYGHYVLRLKDKGRSKMTWKKKVEEESVNVSLRREDALC